jgi:hypothetical protein
MISKGREKEEVRVVSENRSDLTFIIVRKAPAVVDRGLSRGVFCF